MSRLLTLLAFLAAACAGPRAQQSPPQPPPGPESRPAAEPAADEPPPLDPLPDWAEDAREIASNDGTYAVWWAGPDGGVPQGELFDLFVHVRERASGRPAEGLELAVEAVMPAHRHGMNVVPRVVRTAPGTFRVEGMQFHMPGRWVVHLDATRGPLTERAEDEVVLE